MKRLLFNLFIIISSTMFICDCSSMRMYNINISEIGAYPEPLFQALPLKVGAYYGEDLRTFDTIQQYASHGKHLTKICKIQTGKANIALFDYTLSKLFEKVTLIQHLSDGSDHCKDIDLIIEPTVHSYTYAESIAGGVNIHIIYAINFYLPEGGHINSWKISGKGHIPPPPPWFFLTTETSDVIELTQMAMREVAAKFMNDFCNQADIKKLFYSECDQ